MNISALLDKYMPSEAEFRGRTPGEIVALIVESLHRITPGEFSRVTVELIADEVQRTEAAGTFRDATLLRALTPTVIEMAELVRDAEFLKLQSSTTMHSLRHFTSTGAELLEAIRQNRRELEKDERRAATPRPEWAVEDCSEAQGYPSFMVLITFGDIGYTFRTLFTPASLATAVDSYEVIKNIINAGLNQATAAAKKRAGGYTLEERVDIVLVPIVARLRALVGGSVLWR